jgi:hypothetical protein
MQNSKCKMQKGLAAVFAAAIVVACCAAPALDASCGSTSCPIDLQAIQNADASRFSLDLSFQSIDQDQPRIGTRGAYVGEIASDHDEIRTVNHLTSLQFNYFPSRRFGLSVTLPYVSRFHEHFDTETQQIEKWHFGAAGDAAVQGRARVYLSPEGSHDSLWVTAAIKLPTGARHESGSSGEDAEVPIEPGSGSLDATVGVVFNGGIIRDTTLGGRMGHATLIPYFVGLALRENGLGTRDYRRGRELQLNAGTEYPLTKSIHFLAQINSRTLSRDDVGSTGENRNLTGGSFIFASPGVRVLFERHFSLYGFVQLPLYQRVNGLQLTARANYLAGLRQQW